MKLHYLVAAAAIVMSLTACDGSDAKWHTDSKTGECLSVSREHNYIARVSPQGISFFSIIQAQSGPTGGMRMPDCPGNNGHITAVPTEIVINGTHYPSTMLCLNGASKYLSWQPGEPGAHGDKSARALSAEAVKSFTSFFGADVKLGIETAHFGKGNFTKTCAAYIPHKNGTSEHSSHQGILGSLLGNNVKKKQGEIREMKSKGYTLDANGHWVKGYTVTGNQYGGDDGIKDMTFTKESNAPVNDFLTKKPSPSDTSSTQPAPTLSRITPQMEAAALKDAQDTWLVSHPGIDISGFTWEKTSLPDKNVNGKTLHELRFTTTDPQTHITSDVDVEIEPDGTPGYAISNDRPAPAPAAASEGVSAYCRLDNGKSISVTAADGQDYHYAYRDKNDQTELELTEGLFGVKAYHYRTQLGMGSASYIRFNKKQYDYVLISKDTGRQEFQGLKVYKDGNLISTHPCFSALKLDASGLTDTTHADSDKAGDFFIN